MSAVHIHPLVLDGELTVQAAADLKPVMLAAFDAGTGVEVDLSGISELDTAGLQLLLMLKRQAGQLGQTLLLMNPSLAVQEVLALTRLDLRLDPMAEPAPTATHTDQKRGA